MTRETTFETTTTVGEKRRTRASGFYSARASCARVAGEVARRCVRVGRRRGSGNGGGERCQELVGGREREREREREVWIGLDWSGLEWSGSIAPAMGSARWWSELALAASTGIRVARGARPFGYVYVYLVYFFVVFFIFFVFFVF